MAKTNLKPLSVYAQAAQDEVLTKAAAKEGRSVSNFLLFHGLQRAEEMGFTVLGMAETREPEKARAAGGGGRRRARK